MERRKRLSGRATWWVAALTATTAAALWPAALAAQEGCEFGEDGNDVLRQVTMTGGEAIFYVTRPHFICEGGIQIWADSAEAFTSTNLAHLIGSVRYEDPARTLVSDEARYFSRVGRLQAEGGLLVEDRDQGSTIENGALVYLRSTDFRPDESMTVTARSGEDRPRATLVAAPDSSGASSPTERVYVVVGDRIVSRGNAELSSTGTVELTFDSIQAFSDTLQYDEMTDRLDLRGNARVDAPEYDLRGGRVELTTPEMGSREIRALRDAELTGQDFVLTADRILLFARDDRMERLVALQPETDTTGARVPTSSTPSTDTAARPMARADGFEITADSLEILAPEERLERVFAAGRARSVSTDGDSLTVESLPEIARTDWLEGDTIVVTFAAEPPADQAEPTEERAAQVDRIVATFSARSLYRLVPSDPASVPGVDPPAVHYVVGNRITIVMRDGVVDRLEVDGQTTGIHLEPLRRGGPER